MPVKFQEEDAMYYRKPFFLLSVVLTLGLAGCASYQYGRVDVRLIDQYSLRTIAGGISLAVEPYDTTEKAKEGFYEDVTTEDFYPVQLIFQNDSNDRIIVLRETVELVDAGQNVFRPVRSTIMFNAFEKNKMAYALLGFGIFSYMSAEEANRKMETDWREKEIPDNLIVSSGRKANGFVYFKLPKGQKIKGSKLRLEVEALESKKKIPLELILS